MKVHGGCSQSIAGNESNPETQEHRCYNTSQVNNINRDVGNTKLS
jgi:hypothetical protein